MKRGLPHRKGRPRRPQCRNRNHKCGTKIIHTERHRMSIEAISAVLHHSQSSGTARAVLTAIAWHIGEHPEEGCYPSQKRLAELAGCSKRQVQRALEKLDELNEIQIAAHDGQGYRADRITNRYWLLLECPKGCDSTLMHKPVDNFRKAKNTGSHLRRNGVSFKTQRDGVDVHLKVI